MSCKHSSPRLISKFFCTVCQTFYGETEITVDDTLVERLRAEVEGVVPLDGQSPVMWRTYLNGMRRTVQLLERLKEARDG